MTDDTRTGQQPVAISFEFFPPKTTEATLQLWRSVERLAPLAPSFVSVTYGAGGTTRKRTRAAIRTIQDRARLTVAGHLTCVDASRAETLAVADDYRAMGVNRIVALRGDPPAGAGAFAPHPDGYAHADALVADLADRDFHVTVAAYPETHPEAADAAADIDVLRRKFAAGASSAITQFFFEAETYLRFRDAAAARGVDKPIIPGILPIENFTSMARFAKRCGAQVPDWMATAFGNARTEDEATLLATAIATELCDTLRSEGADHLHFYTLNKPDLTYAVARAIGCEPVRFGLATGTGAA